MEKSTLFRTFFTRFFIVFLYGVIIAFFLYIPRMCDFFSKRDSLFFYSYADMVSFETIKEFQEKTGIKVSIKYYDSAYELLAKFKINRGEGYDLIVATDYVVELLRRDGMLAPLDHTKLAIINELDPRLRGKYFDPHNKYSLPLCWYIYGIIYKKKLFNSIQKTLSLEFIFNNPYPLNEPMHLCMPEDYREVSLLASLYLFGDVQHLTDDRIEKIKKLLVNQRRWVENYVHQDLRYFLFSGIVNTALTPSAYILRVLKESQTFDFRLPTEGSLISIENIAMSASTQNRENVYKFMNFLLSKKISAQNSDAFGYNPSNKHAYDLIEKEIYENKNIFPDDEMFKKLYFLHNDVPEKKLQDMWLAVKSS